MNSASCALVRAQMPICRGDETPMRPPLGPAIGAAHHVHQKMGAVHFSSGGLLGEVDLDRYVQGGRHWSARHQFVTRQPVMTFFSSAYLVAASLTIGAITLSSLVYQSDETFQFLPSHV
jgi:hypothetical protein